VKSLGIARDIGLPEKLVVNYKALKSENDLQQAFKYLVDNEDAIKDHLVNTMPEYCQKAYRAKEVLVGRK
jgi:hypothetical protein